MSREDDLINPPTGKPSASASPDPVDPDEWDDLMALDAFLISDAVSDRTMPLDMLDGYMTAIVIGPTTLPPSQWFPGIWGDGGKDAPVFESEDEAKFIMGLIIGHYNDLAQGIEQERHEPIFDRCDSGEYLEAEKWASGFMKGIALCRRDWQALFDDPRGPEWMAPIRLLGGGAPQEEEPAGIATPQQRHELALKIGASVAAIHRFWLPHREASQKISLSGTYQREQPKVGRNDPCPCGSGKKFKKCCGA